MVKDKCLCMGARFEKIRVLEQLLFLTSPTVNHYTDISTLESRIKELSIRILKRRLAKKRKDLSQIQLAMTRSPGRVHLKRMFPIHCSLK